MKFSGFELKNMKTRLAYLASGALALASGASPAWAGTDGFGHAPALQSSASQPIAWGDIGAKATAQYAGDGLSVTKSPSGEGRLRCDFQKLEGEVTSEGLWLTSTAAGAQGERFRVVAERVGRDGAERSAGIRAGLECAQPANLPTRMSALPGSVGAASALPRAGQVVVAPTAARFVRPGLVEEYSGSVDGERQDFVVAAPPAGTGDLRVELAVSGARAETAAAGVSLVLDGSGRKLAYNRLHVVDAAGRELAARMEVTPKSEIRNPNRNVRSLPCC